jgi:hypothetical protein
MVSLKRGKIKIEKLSKERLSMISLFLFSFFLPFGYDVLFAMIMKWTGSYWITDVIFYLISGLFFISYIFLRQSGKNEKGKELLKD